MEKTTAFGLPFFYRIALPGGIATVLSLPLLGRVLPQIGISPDALTAGAVAFGLLVGFLLDLLDDDIYKIFEGVRWWPRWLRDWRTSRWQSHVDRLIAQCDAAKDDAVGLGAIWSELTDFPQTSRGRPQATRPTRLGNIIAGYESYPHHRYGMNGTVYWPRLWTTLARDVRETIDRDWASADALVHLTAAFVLVGVAYIVTGVISLLAAASGGSVIFESNDVRLTAVYAGFILVVALYVPYRLSLGAQRRNGATFRSTFDLYRGNLITISLPQADEWKRWDELGDRLLYAPSPSVESAAGGRTSGEASSSSPREKP